MSDLLALAIVLSTTTATAAGDQYLHVQPEVASQRTDRGRREASLGHRLCRGGAWQVLRC